MIYIILLTLTFILWMWKLCLLSDLKKVFYPQLSEESIQTIWKSKRINLLMIEKHLPTNLTNISKGMGISVSRKRWCWRKGEDAILLSTPSCVWACRLSQLILTRKCDLGITELEMLRNKAGKCVGDGRHALFHGFI